MVNENEERYEGEEGEYQFSDDQLNYDLENETKEAPPSPPQSLPQKILTKMGPYRRMIIGVVGFLVILFIVYKLLSPPSTTPPTDITPSGAAKPIPAVPATTQQPVVPAGRPEPTAQAQTVEPKAAELSPPAQAQMMPAGQQPGTPPGTAQTTAQTSLPQTTTQPALQASPPQPPTSPLSQMMQQISPPSGMMPPGQLPTPPIPTQTAGPNTPPTAPPLMSSPPPPPQSEVANRISALESQNANLLNMLQNQYSQKISEYDMQNKAMQERVHTLNKRLANMEATLNKMAQIMRDGGMVKTRMVGVCPPPRSAEPKMIYTVQAIIPGRAWLKSDVGDTVTIAEGDILKDYGRIAKIDPYDGVVQIDTGNKIIVLSYGSSEG